MKKLGLLTMGIGFLATLSSTFFTVIQRRYNALPIILFWILLTAFESYATWVWLLAKTTIMQRTQKVVLISLIGLTLIWIVIVSIIPDTQSIFVWALKTLNNSGLFFIGLIIYYRASKASSNS